VDNFVLEEEVRAGITAIYKYVIRHLPSGKLCRIRTDGKDTGRTKTYYDKKAAMKMLRRLNNGEEPRTVVIPS
jgi:hypothetical protein